MNIVDMTNPTPLTHDCPYCDSPMRLRKMQCERCGVSVEAEFPATPLSRLPTEHQRFIEMFVLASGSLKEIAAHAGVSYPTVRSRLDKVIGELRTAMEQDQSASKSKRVVRAKSPTPPTPAEIIKRI